MNSKYKTGKKLVFLIVCILCVTCFLFLTNLATGIIKPYPDASLYDSRLYSMCHFSNLSFAYTTRHSREFVDAEIQKNAPYNRNVSYEEDGILWGYHLTNKWLNLLIKETYLSYEMHTDTITPDMGIMMTDGTVIVVTLRIYYGGWC